jgi:hypothetical protein
MARSKQTAANRGDLLTADAAVPEGDDIPVEQPLARIPVSRSELYGRLDSELRKAGSALAAVHYPVTNPFLEPIVEVFECELRTGGRVKEIDLEKRSRELNLITETESPIQNW